MREKLIQYVNLLFAGVPDSDEIRAEILQNTLDRFDDLVAQGKAPEAAYRLAISGIGDINEILGSTVQDHPDQTTVKIDNQENMEDIRNKKIRAIGIAIYILCALPLIILGDLGLDSLGLCLTLALVACATYLMIITGKKDSDDEEDVKEIQKVSPQQELKNSIGKLISAISVAAFFIVSFATGAWYITWIIFPIVACVRGLVNAIIDLKEVSNHEN